MIRPLAVVVASKSSKPASSARLTAPPERIEAFDSHRDGLKPFFDVVSLAIVELTALFTTTEGSQIASGIDQKLAV